MAEDIQAQIEEIRGLILKHKKPSYQTTNRKEVRVRCCYCGDSKKDRNHAHMYISMQPPFAFYCQKCSTSGVLNSQTLKDLGIYNSDASVTIIEANKSIKKNKNQTVNFRKVNPTLNKVESQASANALNYFMHRYNKPFTNEYVVDKFKAITNARQFFEDNKIYVPQGQYDFDNSIGFLSSDGTHVIFRDITGQQRKRYYNLNMFQSDDSMPSNKIYNIKTRVDILSEQITLVISEGVFDIIGVYEHFYKDQADRTDHIFAAAAGKGYGAVVAHYVRMGFLNLNVVIYSDSDVEVDFFKDLKSGSVYLRSTPITIFYNTIGKDFGVPADQIKLRKAIV
jgi:hypothetical protein